MIDPGKLAELADLWGGSPPHVTGGRCLNVRHQARDCRICVEACPTNAISLPDREGAHKDPVVLDQEACVRCGLCLHACPTEVFSQTGATESSVNPLYVSKYKKNHPPASSG